MIAKWRKLPRTERLKYQAVFALLIFAFYSGLFFPRTFKRYFEASKMLHRKQDRIEKRTSLDDIGGDMLTTKTVQKKIDRVEQQIAEVESTFDELDTGFAPEDSSAMRQQLMLEVYKLAERTGLEIISAQRKGFSGGDGKKQTAVLDPVIGRPLLVITAQAPFDNLHKFLLGLKDLSFHMAVMKLNIYSGQTNLATAHGNQAKRFIRKNVPPGYLYVHMEASI